MQPLSYLQTTGGIVWTAACVLLGFALTWTAFFIINKIPAAWLCDYNETPSEELLNGRRVNYSGAGIILSFVSAACLVLCRLQFNKGFDIYFIVLSLIIMLALMIAVCDIKYTIIPDQFTAAVGILGIIISVYDLVRGFGILHTAWWSPLAGAAIGAGTMMFIDFIGMIVYKKDGMGFGDVKLFAAIGLVTGFPGTILVLILSMITGAVFFCGILLISRLRSRSSAKEDDAPAAADAAVNNSAPAVSDADEISASETEATSDQADETGYLAFGPYIALALMAYLCFFDIIYYLVELYLHLF